MYALHIQQGNMVTNLRRLSSRDLENLTMVGDHLPLQMHLEGRGLV